MAITVASEAQPVHAFTSRLRAIVEKADDVQPVGAATQPLPIEGLLTEIDALQYDTPSTYDQGYRYNVSECAAREVFYAFVGRLNCQDPGFSGPWHLLDILMHAGDRDICAPDLVCLLIEELMDSLTTTDCRTVMDYLESRRETLAKRDFHKKSLVLLRACNELLRRLSRAEDAIFCGRVFFFLFMAFPLGDRSSVNLRGEFHTENTTKFEVVEAQSQQEDDNMDVETKKPVEAATEASKPATPAPTGKPGSKAAPSKTQSKKEPEEPPALSNHELYPIFWRLQQDFSDPTQLFTPAELQRFRTGVDNTVAKFKRTAVVQTRVADESKRGIKRKLDAESMSASNDEVNERSTNNYNPKYLTSRELFDLELSDLAFQRHVLVQSLILIDFLLSLTERARKKSEMNTASNKALVFKDFMLTDKDAAWAMETRSTINNYLSVSPEGRLFQRMVDTVLARDKNWVRWKLDACPSIVKEPASTDSELEAREKARRVTKPRHVPIRPDHAMDLSFLDESSGVGLQALKAPARFEVMSVDGLMTGIDNDELDLDMAMTDEETTSLRNAIANKGWRLLRQVKSTQLGLLDKVGPGKDLRAVFRPPVEEEDPHLAVEAVDDAPTAEDSVNGGPDVVVTAEADTEQSISTADATASADTADEPTAAA